MVNQTTVSEIRDQNSLLSQSEQIVITTSEPDNNDNIKEQEHLSTTKKTTEEIVKEYFIDTPVMIDIAFCESRFRHHDKNGNVLRGQANRSDVGVMQINEKYHSSTAAKLGIDFYTLEGNLAYAEYLYKTSGTRPWVHSSGCWNSVREIALK